MSNAEIAADLRAARQYILDHGWTQGRSRADDGSVCALGAIVASLGLFEGHHILIREEYARYEAANRALTTQIGISPSRTSLWNDAPQRTLDDVLNAFEKAAIHLEEQA